MISMSYNYVRCPKCNHKAWKPDVVEKRSKYGAIYLYRRYRHPKGGRTGRNKNCYVRC